MHARADSLQFHDEMIPASKSTQIHRQGRLAALQVTSHSSAHPQHTTTNSRNNQL